MNPTALINYLRDGLASAGHPAVGEVADLEDAPGVRVACPDGVTVFAKVAWVGKAEQRPPQPTWPSREDLKRGGRR